MTSWYVVFMQTSGGKKVICTTTVDTMCYAQAPGAGDAAWPHRSRRNNRVQVVKFCVSSRPLRIEIGIDGLFNDANGVVLPPVQVGADFAKDVFGHVVEWVTGQNLCGQHTRSATYVSRDFPGSPSIRDKSSNCRLQMPCMRNIPSRATVCASALTSTALCSCLPLAGLHRCAAKTHRLLEHAIWNHAL